MTVSRSALPGRRSVLIVAHILSITRERRRMWEAIMVIEYCGAWGGEWRAIGIELEL